MQCLDTWVMVSYCPERESMGKEPTGFPWRRKREWEIVFWNEKWKWLQPKQFRFENPAAGSLVKNPSSQESETRLVFRLHQAYHSVLESNTLIFFSPINIMEKYLGFFGLFSVFFLYHLVQPKRIVCGEGPEDNKLTHTWFPTVLSKAEPQTHQPLPPAALLLSKNSLSTL